MKRLLFLSVFILLISCPAFSSENEYTIITSDRMKNSTKALEDGIRNVIGGLKPSEIDYESDEARKWIEKLDIRMIPYVIFGKDIIDNEKFVDLAAKKMIIRKNGEFVIPEAMLAPFGAMLFKREYKPGQLDIFVMSECPYGSTALAQMANYLEKNSGAVNVTCRYIATFREFGIDSLHGPEEIKEDINQLLIQARHPDKFWEYLKKRQPGRNFEDICRELGIDAEALKGLKEEGVRLLEIDANLCKELGISASPTFLWENQVLTNSIEALRQLLPQASTASEPEIAQGKVQSSYALQKIIVFHNPGCPNCKWLLNEYIPELEKEFRERVAFEYYDTSSQENFEKKLAMEKEYGVIGSAVPEVLIGQRVLMGKGEIERDLKKIIENGLGIQAQEAKAEPVAGNSSKGSILVEHFKSFSPFAIAGAGFLDGINPCAFSTIIFFFSFLAFLGFNFRYMLLAGISFTLAVFLTYLGLGVGAFAGLRHLGMVGFFARYFDFAVGVLAIILGIASLYDYIYFKISKKTDRMVLKLPQSIKNAIHGSVRIMKDKDKGQGAIALIKLMGIGFIVGVLVSLLESVCTGQMYLPTITFILKMKVMWARAFSYLALYNLMFILPLVIVFILSIFGINSKWWADLVQRSLGKVKLLTAILFFGLGIFILLWK